MLQACQTAMNQAVHTSTGSQPFFVFFSRHPPRLVTVQFPSVDGDDDELAAAHALIQATHQKMAGQHRRVANRGRKNQSVGEGSLVWVRRETAVPGTCRKLNPRWDGVYRVSEVLLEGSAYIFENVFTGKQIQRAAPQVKSYCSEEEWLLEPPTRVFDPDPDTKTSAPLD